MVKFMFMVEKLENTKKKYKEKAILSIIPQFRGHVLVSFIIITKCYSENMIGSKIYVKL